MNVTIQKWGNSLAVRIPKVMARDAHLGNGSIVNLTTEEGKVVIEPLHKVKYRLEELLKRVSKKNIHSSVETGLVVGREVC